MPEHPVRRSRRTAIAAVVASLVLIAAACDPDPPEQLPIGDFGDSLAAYVASPNTVAGANDWNCKPSAAHPKPVVLVHGTIENLGSNWVALSPMLKNAGYCVYALNYGMNLFSAGRFGGLANIADSAQELKAFVNKVTAKSGATKVDIVGHSQGGMMPNYYIKRLGGAAKVDTLIGLSPSNHGTTLSGVVTLGSSLNLLGFANSILVLGTPGLVQQEVGSSFQNALWADGDTVPGVRYVVLQTSHDEVVTPYANAFLSGPNVTNILVQNQCPDDNVGHIGMFLDSPTLQNVMNQLGPNTPGFQPVCTGYGMGL
ncbi:MAG TPA: alpha/beta fold hydrolase [Acidimicrobiales bacterium]|nr:alpha/beta fold hydrolase [Acidimicrobiales bacterium]